MSENLCDTYSNVEEVRQLIDIKIEHLKQLLDERRVQLNHELDKVEQEATSCDETNRSLIQELKDHEKITVSLFGKSDISSHLKSIKLKISSLERERERKRVYFNWSASTIADNMRSLGNVAFKSKQIYTIDNLFKQEVVIQTKLATQEKEITLPQESPIEEINNEKYMRVVSPSKAPSNGNKPSSVSKKPTLHLRTNTDQINKPPSHYENLRDAFRGRELHKAFSEQAIDRDESSEITYETFEENTVATPEKAPVTPVSSKSFDGDLCESEQSELSEITYELMEEYTSIKPARRSTSIPMNLNYNSPTKKTNRNKSKLKDKKVGEELMYETNEFSVSTNEYIKSPQKADQEYEIIDESTLVDPVELTDKPLLKVMSNVTGEKKGKSLTVGRKSNKWVYDLPIISVCNQGAGISQLNKPKGVCLSDTGKIFVAEKGNNRVQVFSNDGDYLYMFGEKSGQNKMVEPNGIWASIQFVYVTLPNQNTIQMYTIQGGFLKQKSKEGKEEGKLKLPCGISGDTIRERIYVCDTGNNRIQIFDHNLHFIQVMRTTVLLDKPLDIKVINCGNLVIVLDRSPKCIHMFKGCGELIKEIIEVHSIPKLVNPLYLMTHNEDILLSDYSSNCVHVFSNKGELIWSIGEAGRGKPFDEPRGLACDKNGRLVTVCNRKEDQLQIFEI